MSEKLQKVLARSGLGSRRACEDLIRSGRVNINDRPAALGDRVDPASDRILVDGKPLASPDKLRYIRLNKPSGYLASRRSQGGHPTIYHLLQVDERVFPVGRLDLHSEGLILLTNDGELAQRLTHPRYEHEREYEVQFQQAPTPAQLQRWRAGLQLPDGYLTQRSEIEIMSGAPQGNWCRVVLREGRKRQIRLMSAVLGLRVLRLVRTRIATLLLQNLGSGAWQDCSSAELRALRESVQRAGYPK